MGHENGGWMNSDQRDSLKPPTPATGECPIRPIGGGPVTHYSAGRHRYCRNCGYAEAEHLLPAEQRSEGGGQ